MSKSKGNLVFVSALRDGDVDPMAIRLALLRHHYRSDWEWTDAGSTAAVDRLARWRAAVARARGPPAGAGRRGVRAALADDLDAPAALAAVDRWAAATRPRAAPTTGAGVVSRAVDALSASRSTPRRSCRRPRRPGGLRRCAELGRASSC